MKVDYLIHDDVYRMRRAKGERGWSSGELTDWYLDRLAEWIEGQWLSPVRVLELGCGAGDQALMLAERGHQVTGIDISPVAIDWAREKAAARGLDARFLEGSVLDLPFPDGSFDWVLDGSCWHCIVGEDRRRFLPEIRRVLRPGGIFTGAPMVNGSRFPNLPGYDAERRLHEIGGVTVRYWALVPEILSELEGAGMTIRRHFVLDGESHRGDDLLFVDAEKPA